jgi:hypothetical protein
MKRCFIENQRDCFKLRLRLKRLKEKSILGNPLYEHRSGKQKWERYTYEKVEHLRITGTGYRRYPYPSTSELIEMAIHSNSNEEVAGAAGLLFQLEFHGKEY